MCSSSANIEATIDRMASDEQSRVGIVTARSEYAKYNAFCASLSSELAVIALMGLAGSWAEV